MLLEDLRRLLCNCEHQVQAEEGQYESDPVHTCGRRPLHMSAVVPISGVLRGITLAEEQYGPKTMPRVCRPYLWSLPLIPLTRIYPFISLTRAPNRPYLLSTICKPSG